MAKSFMRQSGRVLVVVALVFVMLACGAPASASATLLERGRSSPVGYLKEFAHGTVEHVAARAQQDRVSADKLGRLGATSAAFQSFDCGTSKVVVPCVEVRGGRCYGDDWEFYDEETQEDTTISGADGIDVCTYSTCVGAVCRDAVFSEVVQLFDGKEPRFCTCAPASVLGTLTLVPTDDEFCHFDESSRFYPEDNQRICVEYVCDNASLPPANLVPDPELGCACRYPRSACTDNITRRYRASQTGTTRMPVTTTTITPTTETPDPVVPDEPTTASPMSNTSEAFRVLDLQASIARLCPNTPPSLTPEVVTAQPNSFCCTTYRQNSTVTTCGARTFMDMRSGQGYCESTIPSFEFCCQVERLPNDMFIYRGPRCARDVNPLRDSSPLRAPAAATAPLAVAAALAAAVLAL